MAAEPKESPANNPGLHATIDQATKRYFMQQTVSKYHITHHTPYLFLWSLLFEFVFKIDMGKKKAFVHWKIIKPEYVIISCWNFDFVDVVF